MSIAIKKDTHNWRARLQSEKKERTKPNTSRYPRCRFMREAHRLTTIADAIHQAHEVYVEAMLQKQLRAPLSDREQALMQESQEWLNEHKNTCPHVDSSQEGMAQ